MKNKILVSFLLMMLSSLGVYGHSTSDADSLKMPEKILNLPSEIINEGDRAGDWGLPTLIALRYGLTVDETVDERLDGTFSRQAAMKYLTDLYAEFGDWDLVYYAYLYSPTYVRNLQLRNLSIPQPKPEVKRPAKAKIPDKTKTTDNSKNDNKSKAGNKSKTVTYTVKSGDTLSKIAKQYHVSVSDLKKWNNLKSDRININQKLKIHQ